MTGDAVARIGIIGGGVLGRQLVDMLTTDAGADVVTFDDPRVAEGDPTAAPFAAHLDDAYRDRAMYVGLGYRHLARKQALIATLLAAGRDVPALIHPSAYVDPSAQIGAGAVIFPRCTIGPGVVIGAGVLLHCNVTVAHDVTIGAASYLAPAVAVSGFVAIGARSFIGTATAIANGVSLGDDVIVGIATCVTRNLESGSSAIGNPMRVLDRPLKLT